MPAIKEFEHNGIIIKYEIQYKKVKNINLRVKEDGRVYVSANARVPSDFIDKFVVSKAEFIYKTLEKFKNNPLYPQVQYFSETEVMNVVEELCQKIYPYFKNKGFSYPVIKFKCMVSRWGSCCPAKGVITFNTNLMYAPLECIEYVVKHEYTHFLQPNHSAEFYNELSKICPEWKTYRKMLKEIRIRK